MAQRERAAAEDGGASAGMGARGPWWLPGAAAMAALIIAGAWKAGTRATAPAPAAKALVAVRRPAAIKLPRPGPGGVPDTWGKLTLGMSQDDVPATHVLPAPAGAAAGTVLFVPDSDAPADTWQLSFAAGHLFRIVQRLGDDSGVDAGEVLGPALRMYGSPRGFEYADADGGHVVTVFADASREFRVDSLKRGGIAQVFELSLTDLEHTLAPSPSSSPSAPLARQ